MIKMLATAYVILLAATSAVQAQQPPQAAPPAPPTGAPSPQSVTPPPYGPPIGLETAKKVMAAAETEAEKNKWPVVIAILDSGGNVVMLHRYEDAQLASLPLAEGKARTALMFKRPSKALEDAVAAGGAGLRFATLQNVTPLSGGNLILMEGKIVGAIGVSGVTSAQHAQIVQAGLDALK
ncbi:MAG TPA: heme-binding protein [Xanthobacteraceae bacterium]|jgi:glc operon protein GlcG